MAQSMRMATPLDMIAAHLTWMRAARGTYAATTIDNAGKLLRRLHTALPAGLHGALGEELAAWLGAGAWSEETVCTYYKHIVRFYRWAAAGRDPWLSYDPSADLRRPTAKPGLPRPALHAVVHAAVYGQPGQWRLVCRLSALAGLRPCEVATVTRVDVTRDCITIKGKGGKTRAIPTHPLIWELVEPMPAGPLITGPHGRPVDAETVSKAGAYHLRRAGLDITLYRLRHYFGTTVQETYRDLRVTQELMGHATPVTTQGYTMVTDARMREAIASLPFSLAVGTGAAAGAAAAAGSADVAPPPRPRPSAADRRAVGRVLRSRSPRRARP